MTLKASFCAAATTFALIASGLAGTINVTMPPSFSPPNLVSNNSISFTNPRPELLKIFGNATVFPFSNNTSPEINGGGSTVTLTLGGTFTADGTIGGTMNDLGSFAYNFGLNLNSTTPANFELRITLTVPSPFPGPPPTTFMFGDTGAIQPGSANYADVGQAQIPPIAFIFGPVSGTFVAELIFSFPSQVPGDSLDITIPNDSIDFQVAPTAIPEPSTYALVAVGLAGLAWARRRRAARA